MPKNSPDLVRSKLVAHALGAIRYSVVAVALVGCATAPSPVPSTETAVPIGASQAEVDVREITRMIEDRAVEANRNNADRLRISEQGAVEFWSSGGLLHYVSNNDAMPDFEIQNLVPKHIEVIPLVPGEAAVAMYYSEGFVKIKDTPAVRQYLTRIMAAFVKEDGEWRLRAAHFSPILGGGGTASTAVDVPE